MPRGHVGDGEEFAREESWGRDKVYAIDCLQHREHFTLD